ncbi:MAG: PorT family protein [Candidatus Cloacimonetes bacterium]|nr:PorT family protein [Candidatus Cloacimonadota bacterium]
MKKSKIIGALVLVLLFSTSLLAQGITGKGVKLGMNLSTFTGDDADEEGLEKKMRIGLAVGGFITYSVNEMFALQPELYYSMQGAKYKSSEGDIDGTLIFRYNYIQIPILAKLNLSMESNIKPNILLGPSLGLNMSAKYEYTDELGDAVEAMGIDKKGDVENVKSTDFGLVFGGGVAVGPAVIDVRYNLGLTTVDDSVFEDDFKNSTISIMVGYSF